MTQMNLRIAITVSALTILAHVDPVPAATPGDYPITAVPLANVKVDDGFWSARLETNRAVSVRHNFINCERTGRISNFEKAAGLAKGEFTGIFFNDSDVYKAIQGAAYCLRTRPDPELEEYLDSLIDKIASAQWADGYLYTFNTVPQRRPDNRWKDIKVKHELYCAGHFFEAAVAYHQATGKKKILDVAIKLADHIDSVFGPNGLHSPPGHQEIELALVELYRATGNEKYLDLAKFFLDQRGRPRDRKLYGEYCQDHKPVLEQTEAVGHAVRATYLYSAMTDVGVFTGSADYTNAADRIWDDIVSGKLHITGGVGPRHEGESFGKDYDLPNKKAYNETCAAIGFSLWNHRLFLLHGHAKYLDVLERTIYNGFLSGVSLVGDTFFYQNPLASDGKNRRPWFNCACCPPNILRFIPSIPGFAYAHRDNTIYVNLFIAGAASVKIPDSAVTLTQQTDYPWNGSVKITVDPDRPGAFAINVRIPGWARNEPVPSDLYRFMNHLSEEPTLKVNGQPVALNLESGFARIDRTWQKGDTVELNLPMGIRRLLSHKNITDNTGKVALQRGPIVYCAEWIDNGEYVRHLALPDNAKLDAVFRPDMLDTVTTITGANPRLVAVPYYAWANRGPGEMAVWFPRDAEKATPAPARVLSADAFKHHVDYFNSMERETIVNFIPNAKSWDWMKGNVPLFECPDAGFEQIYYYRWWTLRKHLKNTPDGFVFTEFLPNVGHSGKYNTISCALGHQIYEGRWLRDRSYLDEYIRFWYRRGPEGRMGHLHAYSNWAADAVYNHYLVHHDRRFLVDLLEDLIADFEAWEKEKLLDNGLFWQYDVRDGMEESISGSRHHKNVRPPLNSYMFANAVAISKIAEKTRNKDLAEQYARRASEIKSRTQGLLWNDEHKFFEVLHENGKLADVREQIGLIPWCFNLPDPGREQAWLQILDPQGFKAPYGLATAEQRHPDFDGDGRRTCEWNGPVWPYATSQTLVALANVLRNYDQKYVDKADYFAALLSYARIHYQDSKPYIGQYLDFDDGTWILGGNERNERDEYYNHSTFCDLVITGLVGLVPRDDGAVEVDPFVSAEAWDWFCLDNVRYHNRVLTILWDKSGRKYGCGKGLRVYADGKQIAQSDELKRITGQLP